MSLQIVLYAKLLRCMPSIQTHVEADSSVSWCFLCFSLLRINSSCPHNACLTCESLGNGSAVEIRICYEWTKDVLNVLRTKSRAASEF
jgi:hypothetical protein